MAGELRCESKQLVHESDLPEGVSFGEPSDLSFADHVHRFVALNIVQCTIHGSEPETGSDSLFNKAVVLLDDVVQVRRRSAAAVAPRFAGSLGRQPLRAARKPEAGSICGTTRRVAELI